MDEGYNMRGIPSNLNRIDISRLFLTIEKNVNRKITKKKLEHYYYLTILTSKEGIMQ